VCERLIPVSTVALVAQARSVPTALRSAGPVSPRTRLLAGAAAGQALALVAVVVMVRVVGPERAGLAPARRRGWLAASGGLLALVVTTAAIRGTLARRPRSRRWIARELAAVEELNPRGGLETALYVPVAIQAALLEELLFRGLLPAALARGGSLTPPTRALLPLFGLGHLYQGLHRVAVTTAFGLLLAEVARAGRSIRPTIALHAALDLQLLWLRSHPLRPAAPAR